MKHGAEKKQQAMRLRKKGMSYGEISKVTGLPKSTLSLWLKGILLLPTQRSRLYTKQIQILSLGPQSQKERRKREIEEIIQETKKEIFLPLSDETIKMFGAALYWAEGSKTSIFQITNSDPYLILFMTRWIEKFLNIPPQNLKARLNIYPQQNGTEIKKFWSQLTGIPIKSFGKTFIKPQGKNYKKNNLYYGTIRVEVPKSVNFKHYAFGLVEIALQQIAPKTEMTKRRWKKLTETPRPVNLTTSPP